ncbi:MAG: hypothetical protein ACTHKZ_00715 [Lysobacteraceae bacterium]
MSISPGASRDGENARLTPRAPGVPGGMDHDSAFLGGNLVGREGSGLDEARGIEPGEGSLPGRDAPIGSLLAARGRVPGGTGDASDAGPHTLGATSGGERAVAGRADDVRSSRADGNTLQSRTDGLE